MRKAYRSSEDTGAPLSAAIETDDLVFVSGQIHVGKNMELQGDTVEEKFKIIIKNIESILAEADLSLDNIVQLRIFLTDLSEIKGINDIYSQYFNHPLPARTAVEVNKLPLGATLEIDAVAKR